MDVNLVPIRDCLFPSYLIKEIAEISKKLSGELTTEEGESILKNLILDQSFYSRLSQDIGLMYYVRDEILSHKEIQEQTKYIVLKMFDELSSLNYHKERANLATDENNLKSYIISYIEFRIDNAESSSFKTHEVSAASYLKTFYSENMLRVRYLMPEFSGFISKNYNFTEINAYSYLKHNIRARYNISTNKKSALNSNIGPIVGLISKSLLSLSTVYSDLLHTLFGRDTTKKVVQPGGKNLYGIFIADLFFISAYQYFSKLQISEKIKLLNSSFLFKVDENFVKSLLENATEGYDILFDLADNLHPLGHSKDSRFIWEYLYKYNNNDNSSKFSLATRLATKPNYYDLTLNKNEAYKHAKEWSQKVLEAWKSIASNDDDISKMKYLHRININECTFFLGGNRETYIKELKQIYKTSKKESKEVYLFVLRNIVLSCRITFNFLDELGYLLEMMEIFGLTEDEKNRLNLLESTIHKYPSPPTHRKILKESDQGLKRDYYLENCKELLGMYQYEQVLTTLNSYLASSPKDTKLLEIKAETLYHVNDQRGVIETYTELLKSNSSIDRETMWRALIGRAIAAAELNDSITDDIKADISSSLDVFDSLPDLNDDESRKFLYNHFIQVVEKIAIWDDIEKECRFVIEIEKAFTQKFESNEWDGTVLFHFAEVFYDSNLYDEAEYCYIRVIEQYMLFSTPLVKLGLIEIERENYEKAQKYLDKAYDLKPESLYVLSAYARLCWRQTDYLSALTYIKRCKELSIEKNPSLKKSIENMEGELNKLSEQYINYNAKISKKARCVFESADKVMDHFSPESVVSFEDLLDDNASILNTYGKGVEILLRDLVILKVYERMQMIEGKYPLSEAQIKKYTDEENINLGSIKTLLYMQIDKDSKDNEYKTLTLGQWAGLNGDFKRAKRIPEVEELKNIFAELNLDETVIKQIGNFTKCFTPSRNPGTHNTLFSYDHVKALRGSLVKQINELVRYLNIILNY